MPARWVGSVADMRIVVLLAVLAAAVTLVAWRAAAGSRAPQSGTLERGVEGDTFVLRGGARVRLLGIDTPETVDPDRPVGCFGPQASRYAKHLLSGRAVSLVYDRELHDRYDRLLAYVYLRGVFVNARLIELGFARTLSI